MGDSEELRRIAIERVSDNAAALAIARSLPGSFTPGGIERMRAALDEETVYGARVEGELAGFASYKALNDAAIELTWLVVSPRFQGQGVGTRLVTESLRAVGASCKLCEVKTLAETHPDAGYARTRAFYRRLGFISVEIIDPYPGWEPGNPCQIFVKCLGETA
jgi:ribosomal protein S18 acetylase RimI-like enzyme